MHDAVPNPARDRLQACLNAQRAALSAHGPLTPERRAESLDGLANALIRHAEDFAAAVAADFGHRSVHETKLADIYPVVAALRHARKHFRQWMKPRRRPIAWMFQPGRGCVLYQPLGLVGIIGPWNYPIQLVLSPLAGALAAGNRVMIKPSEITPRTSALLEQVIAEVFDPAEIAVVQGGPDVAKAFARLKFDHLFFTGSTAVGRQVMQAAADNLVPVTLELGGKSPALVMADYPIDRAAERIAVGKLFNAGQTCIAPDYVLVPRESKDAFVTAFREAVSRLYPTIAANADYTAIVSERHYERLHHLVANARSCGASIHEINPGHETFDPAQRKMAPVVLTDVPDHALVLSEEIFGPVLPVVAYEDVEEACRFIAARPHPLALYLFGRDAKTVDCILARTQSGGVAVNDTLLHCVQEELPFGGVGASGMGAYHGEAGFRTFSHARSVFHQARFNGAGMTRPPYGGRMNRLLSMLLR
ncbi:coniferyl aldehyde dehydrogenase [Microvirga sp. CF3016]|uniref:coniferyl aldehyde dehydrogenase n=1 Tax=Microvirga sp. CF3016 TaxID=3110181 RepID=UPI002E7A774C|nr:coniferyl aldehyde dehydrogenase [Microvirga sp. CF3016]MEE1611044.1 coniferyl aldehyde dehydrogenase [Microvirga sp. CF3016]